MGAAIYPEAREQLAAHRDMIPLPLAKLARRLAQLPKGKAYRVTVWFEGESPRWTVEEVAKIEGSG